MKFWIQTYSQLAWDLERPKPELIRTEDIANSLAYQCRFYGHVKHHYSIAQHSVYVHDICPFKELAATHDMPEAWLGDVVHPLKSLLAHYGIQFIMGQLPDDWYRVISTKVSAAMLYNLNLSPHRSYEALEKKHWAAVAKRFGLTVTAESRRAVIKADRELLRAEAYQLLPGGPLPNFLAIQGVDDIKLKIRKWSPDRAKREFSLLLKKLNLT